MTASIAHLSVPVLRALASALASGRLPLPCTAVHLRGLVQDGSEGGVAAALNGVGIDGSPATRVAALLDLLAEERHHAQQVADSTDLVWSGPEAPGTLNRDTAVVVRELFEEAEKSVLIASYVLDGGERARAIFEPLAERLDAGEDLDVRLLLNIERRRGDLRPDAEIVAAFATHFRDDVWPGSALPAVFYDPRALDPRPGPRACLHAKCIVIDERIALVTSANFTEAAQLRNVEVGVVLRDRRAATALVLQFESLRQAACLRPLVCGGARAT